MQTVPINLAGGTYKHKSLPLSAQVTRNFWPQLQQDPLTKSDYILESFHGLKLFGTVAGAKDRGMLEHRGILYKVTDETLYSINSSGTHTTLGTIPGVSRTVMVGILDNVIIVSDGIPYQWDGATLTTITDSDLETPNAAAHLNNQIIYDGDDGRFWVSDVGDATIIQTLNTARAESNADELLRPYVLGETLYLMGEQTIEQWWNTGVGNPPFDRVQNGTLPIGLGAVNSVSNNDRFMYFLGSDNQVYRVQGSTLQAVTTQAIAREIATYGLTTDAHGSCFNINGQWMYAITFPTGDKTFIYPEDGQWFEWSSGVDGGKTIASSYAFAFRKHLVGDSQSGNVYELEPDTYTNNGEVMIRLRDSFPLHGGLLGAPGKKVTMSRFELIMETGVGLLAGQGQNPEVMLSLSTDGGRTFGTEKWGTIGKLGEFLHKVEWFALGSFDTGIVRIRMSDPVYLSIHSAAADIEVGI